MPLSASPSAASGFSRRSGDAMSVISFPPAKRSPEPSRFALVTKSRGRSPRTRSRHRYLQEAGEGLAALMRDKLPSGLDWAAIYDVTKGPLSDPSTPALLLCVFHRKGAARVGQLTAAGRDRGAPANAREGRDG
jgi:hypothetical protein